MRFTIENVGPIRRSEMEFGGLTILCGRNNTGKTYITYNTFNFMDAIPYFVEIRADRRLAAGLLEKGRVDVDLADYFEKYLLGFRSAMDGWVRREAGRQMAAHEDFYSRTRMELDFDGEDLRGHVRRSEIEVRHSVTRDCALCIRKNRGGSDVDFIMENSGTLLPDAEVLQNHLDVFLSFVFNSYFPDMFIITCERTGVACFRPSFVSPPRRRVSFQGNEQYDEDAPRYPRPLQKDWRFVMEFRESCMRKSFIAERHPEILGLFSEICGGRYSLDKDAVLFEPEDSQGIRLTTTECSSTVRSLMELNFYLKHRARENQVLVIDEPESNLHPENQRRMARLLAMLVNAGLKVLVTTHSDHLIREFNMLIMLQDWKDPRREAIARELGYDADHLNCLLDPGNVRCYVAKDGTVVPMDINSRYGIEVTSFDDSISEVNRLQRRILYGE